MPPSLLIMNSFMASLEFLAKQLVTFEWNIRLNLSREAVTKTFGLLLV